MYACNLQYKRRVLSHQMVHPYNRDGRENYTSTLDLNQDGAAFSEYEFHFISSKRSFYRQPLLGFREVFDHGLLDYSSYLAYIIIFHPFFPSEPVLGEVHNTCRGNMSCGMQADKSRVDYNSCTIYSLFSCSVSLICSLSTQLLAFFASLLPTLSTTKVLSIHL